MTKRQKFKKSYAVELFKIAESDLQAAKLLHGTGQARPETIVFHVQQAIEKSIKAVTCQLEIPMLLIHDIGALLGSLPADRLPPYEYDLTRFNDYAGILRYEEGKAVLDKADIDLAIEVGTKVIDWAKSEISK
jgi:HEPN domain-containing protein